MSRPDAQGITEMTKNDARFETGWHADIGARNEQQDRAGVFEKDGACLIAVADGMGGHSGGALAAEAVVETARSLFEESDGDADGPALLASIIGRAHERIVELGAERQLDPHTTCVLLHLTPAGAHWAHAGDSRLYRLADGRIAERTLDHSKVEQLRLEGRITEEEMATHPHQNWVLQALGGWDPPEISTGSAPPGADEAFLLATDGLWENVIPEDIEDAAGADDLAEALRRLVAVARETGGPRCDNITVAVARKRRDTPPA